LAEVKGPVHETLQHSSLISELAGPIFLSTHAAVLALSNEKEEDYSI
jgi:hypothetical protein